MPKQPPQKRTRRHPERFAGKHYMPYAITIGQLTLAWNALHETLAMLFFVAIANGRTRSALEIWNSAVYDRPKRAMLKAAVADNVLSDSQPQFASDVLWLCGEADKLEDSRNSAIHSPLIFHSPSNALSVQRGTAGKVLPLVAFGNPRAMKLHKKDLLTEFRWCRDAAVTLNDFAKSLFFAVGSDAPWPRRPSLPNRGQRKIRQVAQRPARLK